MPTAPSDRAGYGAPGRGESGPGGAASLALFALQGVAELGADRLRLVCAGEDFADVALDGLRAAGPGAGPDAVADR